MSKIWVARRKQRTGLLIPGSDKNHNVLFFLPKMASSQLDELIRKELETQGKTSEQEVNEVIAQAEIEYEFRVKTQEAIKELRRLMALRVQGLKLMQVGNKKWKEVFYPATTKLA